MSIGPALGRVGSLRCLASRSAPQGRRRGNWAAGAVAAVATAVGLLAVFVIATLYWGEGVLDAGGTETETARSSLFPFFGSRVEISPADDRVAWSMETGPVPFIAAFVVWLIVTRPWRSLRPHPAMNEPDSLRSPDGAVPNATPPRSAQIVSDDGGRHA